MNLKNTYNPIYIQKTTLNSSIPIIKKQNYLKKPFKIQNNNDKNFITTRTLLKLQNYNININKNNDPININNNVYTKKSIPKYIYS